MRITGQGGRSRAAERRASGRPPFAEALRAADRRATAARATLSRAPAARRPYADREASAPAARRELSEEQRISAAVAPLPRSSEADPRAPVELRALARALPVATITVLRAGAPLALALGRSLALELRPTPRGVELVLHADRRLATACTDGLPELVAALARRGVAVARAEVRSRAAPHGRCVDLPPGLR
jgi:hypothetical protein